MPPPPLLLLCPRRRRLATAVTTSNHQQQADDVLSPIITSDPVTGSPFRRSIDGRELASLFHGDGNEQRLYQPSSRPRAAIMLALPSAHEPAASPIAIDQASSSPFAARAKLIRTAASLGRFQQPTVRTSPDRTITARTHLEQNSVQRV
ncbi:hypothetical protein ACLOJK_006500 [Asimina triloba]